MKNGKYTRRSSGMKVTSVLLAALLLVGCSIGATLAWLTATTNKVENTFTVGKVNITLQEHKYVEGTNSLNTSETTNANSYKLIPGKEMPKDPFVTVKENSEKCWIFVAVKDENNSNLGGRENRAVQYDVNEASGGGWNALIDGRLSFKSEYKVYYRVQEAVTEDTPVYILKPYANCEDEGHANGCVEVNQNVTSDNVTDPPTLTFTAAAIQYDGLEVVDGDDEDVDYTLNAAIEAFKNLPDDFKNAVLKPADSDIPTT